MSDTPERTLNEMFTQQARFQRWLDVEASLAKAQAKLGIIPAEAAEAISCAARADRIDVNRYQEMMAAIGHPMVTLLRLFQPMVKGDAGQYIHLGATTQDIMDTASMMAYKKVHGVMYESLRRIEEDLLRLAERYADTVMVGRTHGIHALPITFGYKVAIWAREIRRNIQRLKECQKRIFVAQISGAVGTMAAYGPKGPEVQALVARDLGLEAPDICWQSSRDRFAEFANLLAMVGLALGRIAQEVYLLMSTEVGEVCEPWQKGVVGSSTMPHKINPPISQNMMSLARRLRHNAFYVMETSMVDHERNLEHFLGEREKLEDSCRAMGELLTHGENMAKNLNVDAPRMTKNLSLLKGVLLSEAVMMELGKKIGKQSAHEVIYEDATKAIKEEIDFSQVLMADTTVSQHLSEADIERLLDPGEYIGLAPQIARQVTSLSRMERKED